MRALCILGLLLCVSCGDDQATRDGAAPVEDGGVPGDGSQPVLDANSSSDARVDEPRDGGQHMRDAAPDGAMEMLDAETPCATGYERRANGCVDIDECADDNGGCDALAGCENEPGSFRCGACPAGYLRDASSGCSSALVAIAVDAFDLSPGFVPSIADYAVHVPLGQSSVQVTLTANEGATLSINGTAITSGALWTSPVLALGDNVFVIRVGEPGENGTTYALTVTRGSAGRLIKAAEAESSDAFGFSVALDGDTMVAGAPGNGSDAAYVFVRSGSTWIEQARLRGSSTMPGDEFGVSVAVSGDTAVVGAYFEDKPAAGGRPAIQFAGAAYVFKRSGATWSEQARLTPSNAEANVNFFGFSVAVSGDTVVVGAQGEDSAAGAAPSDISAANAGAAYVFVRSGNTWSEQARLKASNAEADDFFGLGVAVSGDTVIVGAPYEDGAAGSAPGDNGAESAGAAYVFTRSDSAWSEQARLKASNAEAHDAFGYSVAVSGDTVVLGAPYEDGAAGSGPGDNGAGRAGAAYVFTRSGSTWIEQAWLKASNAGADDECGTKVAVSGDTVVVGALREDSAAGAGPSDDSAENAGAAYVFARSSGTWSELARLKAGNAESADWFGIGVTVSGDTVVVGAHGEDSAPEVDPGDNSAGITGAAYVFELE